MILALFLRLTNIAIDAPGLIESTEDIPTLPLFDIPCDVLYNDHTRDVSGITSRSYFEDALECFAERMGVHTSLLKAIAYVPSYKPKSPKPIPKLVEDSDGWLHLVNDVQSFIETCKAKNKGKGKVKEFTIYITAIAGDSKAPEGKLKVCVLSLCRIFPCFMSSRRRRARSRESPSLQFLLSLNTFSWRRLRSTMHVWPIQAKLAMFKAMAHITIIQLRTSPLGHSFWYVLCI